MLRLLTVKVSFARVQSRTLEALKTV